MHKNVKNFINEIRKETPLYFNSKKVLDCGSLNINGSNRSFFKDCAYTGIDIVNGNNVDFVTDAASYMKELSEVYDVVISTEMLEHDKHYAESLKAMFRLLKNGGLLIVTAASRGRKEHGTTNNSPNDSPLTNNYYCNVTVEMLQEAIDFNQFDWFILKYEKQFGDIQFAGIKNEV